VVPTGLIHLVKHGFNTGVDYAGKEITEPTHFLVGCALNLRPAKLETEINLLKKKIDSGADFAMTQPIYESHVLGEFVQQYEARHGELTIPIIMSVMPLHNDRNAEFLHNEVPGMVIPEALRDRMRRAGKQGAQEGLKIALELIFQLCDKIQGIYIMPQFERYHVAAEIIETLERENRELAVSEAVRP
jgi:homocysteine S-methyltransferase